MNTIVLRTLRWAARRRRLLTVLFALTVALVLLAGPVAFAGDVYGNIGPAPQLSAGGLVGRYPLEHYSLDQYFPAISVGFTSGVDASGVAPMIAYFAAQIIWLLTAFLANAVITLFGFAFNLDLLNGNGTPGSGALAPISQAIHNLYSSTFGAPWLIVAVVLAGCWAMWKALVQRRYTETAGALAVSLLYCVLAIGIVTQPERTIGPASQFSNELSTALLSLGTQGSVGNEQQAKTAASNQLFELLVLDPWTVLEFGGVEHCTTTGSGGKSNSVAVRPLSRDPTQETQLASQLESGTEVHAEGKTCINDRNKYAPHFLAYAFQSKERNSEHEALEHGERRRPPRIGPRQAQRHLSAGRGGRARRGSDGQGRPVPAAAARDRHSRGRARRVPAVGALALGVILAQILLLMVLAFAPVALVVAVFPGRGHDFFRAWIGKLAGYLARKVVYSLILAVILAVCQALDDATSNLGWLLAFALQAAFLWAVFLQRNKLAADLLAATTGGHAGTDGASRLQSLYYASRLSRMAGLHRQRPNVAPVRGRAPQEDAPPPSPSPTQEATVNTPPPPRGVDAPEPGDDLGEPIAASEGPPAIPSAPAPDPDEEPA